MADLEKCPNCKREAEKSFSSNWFPVHTCRDCGKKYCDECGGGNGTKCPKCGSSNYSNNDKVYSH
jgi:hypothetical protein